MAFPIDSYHLESVASTETVISGFSAPIFSRASATSLVERSLTPFKSTPSLSEIAPARLGKGDFVTVLRKLLQEEGKAGKASVDVRAANLRTEVGVYPARGHSMPTCCTVMYEEMPPGGEIPLTPPGGKAPTLLVRYKLPR